MIGETEMIRLRFFYFFGLDKRNVCMLCDRYKYPGIIL